MFIFLHFAAILLAKEMDAHYSDAHYSDAYYSDAHYSDAYYSGAYYSDAYYSNAHYRCCPSHPRCGQLFVSMKSRIELLVVVQSKIQ